MIAEAERAPAREAQRRELESYVERQKGQEQRQEASSETKEQKAGKDIKDLVHGLLSSPIAFHPIFGRIAGGALPGLFLSQAYYWTGKGSRGEGWFYKSRDEWQKETMMTRREQQTARSILVEKGLIEEMKEGLPCRLFFRVNLENVIAAIQATTREETQNPVGTKRPD